MTFSVRVTRNGIDGLQRDMEAIPAKAAETFAGTVQRDLTEGNEIAKRFARSLAGPHGTNYYKRLTVEMTGPYSGEYGPEGIPKTDFVGVGFRDGVNLDLPNSADIIGPKFAKDISSGAGGLFW